MYAEGTGQFNYKTMIIKVNHRIFIKNVAFEQNICM
jgi:hypothetical protein